MVDWNLAGNGNNALQMFQYGAQLGTQMRQRREETDKQNALTAYATDPNAPGAFEGLAKADPGLAIQARGQQQQAQQAQREQQRADLPMLGRLLDYAKDEGTYQQARQYAATQLGMDVSSLPQNFDPNWIGQQRQMISLLQDPKAQEALSTAGKIAADMGLPPGSPAFNAKVAEIWQAEQSRIVALQPGGGAASVNPVTGAASMVITPNMGGAPVGAPAGGAQLPPGFTLDQGGPASAPGTFRP